MSFFHFHHIDLSGSDLRFTLGLYRSVDRVDRHFNMVFQNRRHFSTLDLIFGRFSREPQMGSKILFFRSTGLVEIPSCRLRFVSDATQKNGTSHTLMYKLFVPGFHRHVYP